jgi:poly(A) polymerase
MPRRFTRIAREIWFMQPRLVKTGGKRAERLLANPRFRAAYDFLLLRADAGEDVRELAEWWTRLQQQSGAQESPERKSTPRKRRRNRQQPAQRK